MDLSTFLALLVTSKEETEIEITKKACSLTVEVFSKYLKEEITYIIDKNVKHSKLAEGVEKAWGDKKHVKNADISKI